MTEHPEELEQQMQDAVLRACDRMAEDFELMAVHVREKAETLDIQNIAVNLAYFVPRLMQGGDILNGYLNRNTVLGITEEQAASAPQEYIEEGLRATSQSLEECIDHIEHHTTEGEWYSLVYDLSGLIDYLSTQVTGLRVWAMEVEKTRGPRLDDSHVYGKMVWRNPDVE